MKVVQSADGEHVADRPPGAPRESRTEIRLVSSKQAARMLGVSEGTLRYWRCVRTGPPWIKLGRRALYDVADLVEFIARGRRNPSVRTMEVDDVSL